MSACLLVRREVIERESSKELAATAGKGDSAYTTYDAHVTDSVCEWLKNRNPRDDANTKPWTPRELFTPATTATTWETAGSGGKSTMYEESVSVPIILSGADIPKGKKVDTPVSLIDIFQPSCKVLALKLHRRNLNFLAAR